MNRHSINRKTAFSVIELLVLVGIAATLAAIAVPNFLTAQTRSNFSRAKADLRTISVGLEAYHVETSKYPWCGGQNSALSYEPGNETNSNNTRTLERLTTPVSYLTGAQNFVDPFDPDGMWAGVTQTQLQDLPVGADGKPIPYYWYNARNRQDTSIWSERTAHDVDPSWWFLQSAGPDRKCNFLYYMLNSMQSDTPLNRQNCSRIIYDPTNGALSYGGIFHFGGDPSGCWGASFYYIGAKAKYPD